MSKDLIWWPFIYLENVILGTRVVGETIDLKALPIAPADNASVTNPNESIRYNGNNVRLLMQKRFQVNNTLPIQTTFIYIFYLFYLFILKQGQFFCNMDIFIFPFDKQICNVSIMLR